ncbi:MAG: hypothetical protein HY858_09730 [Candidatus Solibacter usitatus]|nr:hypothetical protein [Candidatus Solibacter usitatus]
MREPPLRAAAAVLAAALCCYLALISDGLRTGYFPDEMMNLYGYLGGGWKAAWTGLLLPWRASYRPMGALFYLPLYEAFGLNPLPGRIVCFVLLAAGMGLLFLLALRISGSRMAAVFSVMLGGYHAWFSDLYYSSSTVYDLLAYVFCLGALAAYAAGRRLAYGALFLAALESKETAVLLPVATLGVEIALLGARRARVAGLAALAAAGGLLYLLPRLAGGAFTANAAYAIHLEAGWIWERARSYLGLALFQGMPLSHAGATAAILGVLAAAIVCRSRALWAALGMGVLFAIPPLLIEPRSMYAMFLASAGFAIAGGIALAALLDRVRLRGGVGLAAGATLLAAVLLPANLVTRPQANKWLDADAGVVARIMEGFSAQAPRLRPAARILIVDDPLPWDDYLLTFTLQLLYRDRTLTVDRVKQGASTAADGYDVVADLRGWRVRLARHPR